MTLNQQQKVLQIYKSQF